MLSVLLGDSCPSLVSVSGAGGIATFMVVRCVKRLLDSFFFGVGVCSCRRVDDCRSQREVLKKEF